MKKNIIFAALAAASVLLVSVSCNKQEQPEPSNDAKVFTAVIEQDVTKTVLTSANKVEWEATDLIMINESEYSAIPNTLDATKATFTLSTGMEPTAPYSVIYPSGLYMSSGNYFFPETQYYSAGKFNAPMYAESSTEDLSFKNICGVLCFSLKGTNKVKSIEITANEPVCGGFTMTDATTINFTGTDKSVVLTCTSPVQLDASTATNFYIYLPPNTYTAGMKVTIKDSYDGKFEMTTTKSATVARNSLYVFNWRPEFVPAGALSGKFSVSASKQVYFSKGNLVATINESGTPTAWKFAANQYDCLGEGGANKTIGAAAGDVDLFGWSTAATKYGISTSTTDSDYSGDFLDWGMNIGDGSTWRTLSNDEWVYLFDTRTNASSLYKCGVTVCGKNNCLIIAPDNWDTSANPLQTSYDATTWPAAEAAGLVCLPAAGGRNGSNVSSVGSYSFYWSSSTAISGKYARGVGTDSVLYLNRTCYRLYGKSVRLITESK